MQQIPAPPAPPEPPETPAPTGWKSWSTGTKILVVIAVLVVLAAIGNALEENDDTYTPSRQSTSTTEVNEPSGMTVAQEQALRSAQSYVDLMGFSEAGLLDQLTSEYGEGFSEADARFAVEHVNVDWNQEAVEAAEGYLEMGGFSRNGLIEQLSSPYGEQFTRAQATYAADAVGL